MFHQLSQPRAENGLIRHRVFLRKRSHLSPQLETSSASRRHHFRHRLRYLLPEIRVVQSDSFRYPRGHDLIETQRARVRVRLRVRVSQSKVDLFGWFRQEIALSRAF